MLIQMTQADIRNGSPLECAACPVALAINRYLKADLRALVNASMITIFALRKDWTTPTSRVGVIKWTCHTPMDVADFIAAYDHSSLLPEPISFALPIDDCCCPLPRTPNPRSLFQ